jgi:hypothetical protein
MKQTIDLAEFQSAFNRMRPNNFSHEALGLLFDYFEEFDLEMELDVIAICCEYSEDTVADIAANYSIDLSDDEGEDTLTDNEKADIVREYLQHNTTLVGETADGFVYFCF